MASCAKKLLLKRTQMDFVQSTRLFSLLLCLVAVGFMISCLRKFSSFSHFILCWIFIYPLGYFFKQILTQIPFFSPLSCATLDSIASFFLDPIGLSTKCSFHCHLSYPRTHKIYSLRLSASGFLFIYLFILVF